MKIHRTDLRLVSDDLVVEERIAETEEALYSEVRELGWAAAQLARAGKRSELHWRGPETGGEWEVVEVAGPEALGEHDLGGEA